MNRGKIINFIMKNSKYDTLDKIYPNSKPVEGRGTFDDNGRQGEWEAYDDDGELKSKGKYVNDKKDGEWEYYDGKLFSKGTYIDNKKNGEWEYYWENGKLQTKGRFVNGEMDGEWVGYYESTGNIKFKITYKNGNLI